MERLAKLEALREALVWWDECSYGFNTWGFWLAGDDANGELDVTVKDARAEVERLLQEREI